MLPIRKFSTKNWLPSLLTLRNRYFVAIDAVGLCLTPALAIVLRTDNLSSLDLYGPALAVYTVLGLAVRLVVFFRFGLYRRYWRYASVDDLVQIVLAVMVAMTVIGAIFFGLRFPAFSADPPSWSIARLPRSLPLLDGMLALALVSATRFSVRIAERSLRRQPKGAKRQRVVVVGAGDAGQMIVKEMQTKPQLGLEPVGFLDDDPRKRGVRIHNVPVWGGRELLESMVHEYGVGQAIIAMPSASGKTIRELVALCEQVGVPAKTVPGMNEILDGSVSVRQVRDVQIEDLLRRDPVQTDVSAVERMVRGCRVLVTGAGGSIGSELCRQIIRCEPAELVLVGHGENSIFTIHNELLHLANVTHHVARITPVIADVRDMERLGRVFAAHRPEIVFHAAAHKHVPLMEGNVCEAVTNNVLGTANMLRLSETHDVRHFVLISTDKAVNPSSVMGATKRVAELLVQQAARQSGRPFVAVRFGNVLGSRGSVVLTFKDQIARGGPLTVTHPDVRRFFMTIPEAVQLVLQAATLGQGGEVFLLDMGEPVRIVDLAQDLVRLSGLEVGRDIDIVFTGLRPGDKLFEELFAGGEEYGPTPHDKIFLSLNGKHPVRGPADVELAVRDLVQLARQQDDACVRARLQELVPEYDPRRG